MHAAALLRSQSSALSRLTSQSHEYGAILYLNFVMEREALILNNHYANKEQLLLHKSVFIISTFIQ